MVWSMVLYRFTNDKNREDLIKVIQESKAIEFCYHLSTSCWIIATFEDAFDVLTKLSEGVIDLKHESLHVLEINISDIKTIGDTEIFEKLKPEVHLKLFSLEDIKQH
jgi:hypothetical protein